MKKYLVFMAVIGLIISGCASNLSRYEVGMGYYEAGKYDHAIEEFQASISLNPSDPVVHKALGDVYADKGLILDAIASWEVAMKLRPKYPEVSVKLEAAYVNLASEEYDKGKTDDAKDMWRRVIELNPENIEGHKRLGLAYANENQNDSAIPELEWVLRKVPTDDLVYKKLGFAYFKKGDVDNAARSFEALIRLKPTDAMSHNNLGSIYVKMKKYDDAVNVLEQAVRLAPDKAEIFVNLGKAYYEKNSFKKARENWNRALQLDPINKTAKDNINTLNKMGE